MNATVGTHTAPDGTELLTRSWIPETPKATILLVHGLGEHCARWDHVGSYLADRGYAVIAFDLRGHGESGGPKVHVDSFDTLVADVAAVADLVDPDVPWVLYAHSLGGLVGTLYLESDHRQPAAAVLSAPALDDNLPAHLRVAAEVLGRLVPKLSVGNSITGAQLSRDESVGEAYFADPLVQSKATAGFGRAGLSAQRTAREQLARIAVPTLVVHGAEDRLVPPSASAPLAAVPSVERKLYPGLRHEIHNEPEQDQVLSDIADWLDAALE
jgi:acylglycerol lipase